MSKDWAGLAESDVASFNDELVVEDYVLLPAERIARAQVYATLALVEAIRNGSSWISSSLDDVSQQLGGIEGAIERK